MRSMLFFGALPCLAICICCRLTWAHGFVGDKFFPPTITTDDPFATDELAIPTLSIDPGDGGDPETRTVAAGFEFDKLILPKLALGISTDRLWQKVQQGKTESGWDDLTLSAKYELWRNDPHEMIVSVGMEADLGGTGTKRVGRDAFTTFTPTIYFGKGFGDLPDALAFLKPINITGTIGQTIPTSYAPNALEWGFALEYSIPYLQAHVKDLGLPEPFKNMIPLVEFAMETPENRGEYQTTGTIDPGVLWEAPDFQIGVEALIPINHESGNHIGAIVQLQIYIDDLFPKLFGHAIFGE